MGYAKKGVEGLLDRAEPLAQAVQQLRVQIGAGGGVGKLGLAMWSALRGRVPYLSCCTQAC